MSDKIATDALVPHIVELLREHGIESLDIRLETNGDVDGRIRLSAASHHGPKVVEHGQPDQEFVRGGQQPVAQVVYRRAGFGPDLHVRLSVPTGPVEARTATRPTTEA